MNKHSRFLELLNEPLKIFSQNGMLMAITATIYLLVFSISYILCISSIKPYATDLVFKVMFLVFSAEPGTPAYTNFLVAIREDAGIVLGTEAAYRVVLFIVELFVQTAVIVIASSYYNRDSFSLKKLILKVSKTWTRPFVTSFYVQILTVGYTSIFFSPFLVSSLVLFDHRAILITVLIFLAILVTTFYVHLSVVWSLAVVVSVVEDSCYGFAALGKARELVKGKRVYGFLLTFLYLLALLVVFVVGWKLLPVMPIVVGVIRIVIVGIVSMFMFMAYTAFYFQCKNDMEYSQIQTTTANC